jgi:hypothetical protein
VEELTLRMTFSVNTSTKKYKHFSCQWFCTRAKPEKCSKVVQSAVTLLQNMSVAEVVEVQQKMICYKKNKSYKMMGCCKK